MIETRPDSPLADVGSFILFAMRWRDLVWQTFDRYPPDSSQRWHLFHAVCPRYVRDLAKTRLVRALAAAERIGKGEAWRQLLYDLDSGLKDYARRFVDSAELPCEPSALNAALNELIPAVDAVRQARAADRLAGCGVAVGDVPGWRATRRLGELLKAMEKNVGAKGSKVTGSKREPVKDTAPTLSSLGVTKRQSHEAQRLADVPVGWTADRLAGDGDKPTTLATVPPQPVKRPSNEAIQAWRLRDLILQR